MWEWGEGGGGVRHPPPRPPISVGSDTGILRGKSPLIPERNTPGFISWNNTESQRIWFGAQFYKYLTEIDLHRKRLHLLEYSTPGGNGGTGREGGGGGLISWIRNE